MKNIKRWKEFNEAVWPLSIFTSEYDKQVEDIFDKIKSRFNIEELKDKGDGFDYRMEESNVDSGYVTIKVRFGYGNPFVLYLYIDGEEIPCSRLLCRKIYNFFKEKYKEWEKSKKLGILNKLA